MVFSRTGGDYTTPVVAAEEGVWKGTVGTDGKVGWGNAGKDAPIYPRWGAWLYLVSYAPYAEPDKAASGSGTGTYAGTVSFVLTGQTDLLYASQIQGNRWADGHFPSLVFDHQLTQLSFQAKKTLQNGVSVWVKSITVKEAKPLASLKLATGEVTFSTTTEHPPGTDGGSYAERNQRSRARNGSDRPDSGICGATFTPSVGSRRKQRQWKRKQRIYAESRNINRYIR